MMCSDKATKLINFEEWVSVLLVVPHTLIGLRMTVRLVRTSLRKTASKFYPIRNFTILMMQLNTLKTIREGMSLSRAARLKTLKGFSSSAKRKMARMFFGFLRHIEKRGVLKL